MLLHMGLDTWHSGQASGEVFWLLHPQLVSDAGFFQFSRQVSELLLPLDFQYHLTKKHLLPHRGLEAKEMTV